MLLRILIAVTDAAFAEELESLLAREGRRLATLAPESGLWSELRREPSDLLVVDEILLGPNPAVAIGDIRRLPEWPEVVTITRDGRPERRAELLAAHAFAVLDARAPREDMARALESIIARRSEQAHTEYLAKQARPAGRLSDFSSQSPAMREFLSLVRRVVDTDSTLLVLGATGVGKEYLSRAIHAESPRRDGPFVAVNCSALSVHLLESELFGHVEGAFTGAGRARRGYFEQAHGGTLFLDEIGELSPQLQVKLLRVLQDKKIQPVGAEEEIEVDVRLVAATNRNLNTEMDAGRFRADLYYRLSVVTLEVPPLRRRREDIPGLVESHLEEFRISMSRPVTEVRPDAMALLEAYDWPGNVRELINVIERAVLLCEGSAISVGDLPAEIRGEPRSSSDEPQALLDETAESEEVDEEIWLRPFRSSRSEVIDAFERTYIEKLLQRCHGRVQDSARVAGINVRSLYEKMTRLEIKKEFFKLRE